MTKFFLGLSGFIYTVFFFSCIAQQPLSLSLQTAARGNTGLRGRAPDIDKDKPLQGNDFVEISLTSPTNCHIDSIFVTLKNPDVCLRDSSQNYPVLLKANEVMYLRVENKFGRQSNWKDNMRDTCEGFLDCYVAGKKQQILIKNFKMIIPK